MDSAVSAARAASAEPAATALLGGSERGRKPAARPIRTIAQQASEIEENADG
jgi:hypothetical protein